MSLPPDVDQLPTDDADLLPHVSYFMISRLSPKMKTHHIFKKYNQ